MPPTEWLRTFIRPGGSRRDSVRAIRVLSTGSCNWPAHSKEMARTLIRIRRDKYMSLLRLLAQGGINVVDHEGAQRRQRVQRAVTSHSSGRRQVRRQPTPYPTGRDTLTWKCVDFKSIVASERQQGAIRRDSDVKRDLRFATGLVPLKLILL